MDRWAGRVAVVTGGSEGIGEAIVLKLAACGMKVAALARRQGLLEELERKVAKSGAKGSVKGYICDVSSESDVTAAFSGIEKDFGPISVLVNNAGVLKQVFLTDIDLVSFNSMMDINVKGVMNCTNAAMKSMKLHNVSDGHIINISSIAAHRMRDSRFEYSCYSATKHALKVLTYSLRNQLKEEGSGIRVTAISPGLVNTTMTRGPLIGQEEIRDWLLPADIAESVAFAISAPKHVNVKDIIIEPV